MAEEHGYYVDEDRCLMCGQCNLVCPQHALKAFGPRHIDQSKCIQCGQCQAACPAGVIDYR